MKKSKGIIGYVALLGTLLLIAILLNGGLNRTESKRIEYPELLEKIDQGLVKDVAVRNTSLVGRYNGSRVSDADFPDGSYDFETTIGDDFLETVRQMQANKT